MDSIINVNGQPIARFDAWLHPDGKQKILWPAEMLLSESFYDSLLHHAVPLDKRAVSALRESSLALDVYAWLTHRLCRLKTKTQLPWTCVREQFGHEYRDPKNLKKEFLLALRQAVAVYPNAKVEQVRCGLLLHPSKPPVPRVQFRLNGNPKP